VPFDLTIRELVQGAIELFHSDDFGAGKPVGSPAVQAHRLNVAVVKVNDTTPIVALLLAGTVGVYSDASPI